MMLHTQTSLRLKKLSSQIQLIAEETYYALT